MSSRSFQRVFQGAAIIALFSNPLFLLANPVPSLVKQDWGDFSIFHPSMRSVTSVNSNEGSGVEDVESDDPKLSSNVAWAPCQGDFPVKGKVSAFNISPCNRKNDSDINEPCEFSYGFNYTIKIDFTSELDAHQPRSSLIAGDSEEGPYAYSGQSFEACRYASCPIRANVKAVYTYRLRTLLSHFDSITFNVTQSIDGPSLFCAGTDISFQRPQ